METESRREHRIIRIIAGTLLAIGVCWHLAGVAWALSAGTNITLQNGSIAVSGPPSATTLTTNGVLLGAGTSAITTTSACTGSNQVLRSGSPPACGSLVDADIPNTITVDLATAATALAANGANCSAGQYARGVDASGAAENCTSPPVSIVTFGSGMDITTSQTVYAWPGITDTTEARVSAPMPAATFANLRCRQSAAAGTSNDVTITIRTGTCGSESDSSLVCTISGGASAASCSDTSNSASTTAGQCASAKIVTPASLTNSAAITCSMERTA
ncbi:MAG: hypothetical protein AB7I42_22950 [Bradyrhizobium sp.]|uniref:hypothetical protein n=1 Tax=Bradyrhizobium sp. TaxID=376 RepID=UPI003D0F7833